MSLRTSIRLAVSACCTQHCIIGFAKSNPSRPVTTLNWALVISTVEQLK